MGIREHVALLAARVAAQGVWVEEGTATRDAVGGVYRGSVAHLTPWNIDFWAVPAFKRVTVLDGDGNPVIGAWVTVAPATGGARCLYTPLPPRAAQAPPLRVGGRPLA